MDDPRLARLFAAARTGRLTRRQLVNAGLRLGLASPVILALIEAAPRRTAAAPASAARLPRSLAQEGESGTLTVLISVGTEDIDPHFSYNTLSSTVALATYEMLIQLQGESTDEFAPMLAETWEVSPDQATYTFRLFPGVTFHDGTVCDAQAVKDSYTRFLLLEGGPVNVISRFVQDAEQMEVVDETTIRFNLGRAQPLFLPAMSSQYGPSVISPTAVEENKSEDDRWAHEWLKANAVGSGPYRLVENVLNEGLIFERFEEFHGGWEGNHFDRIVMRVVPEEATRRQLLEQGQADAVAYTYLTVDNAKALEGNPALQVIYYPTTAVAWAILNAPRLRTPEVRQGLSYAFPYDQVATGVYQGLLKRTGPITDNVRGYDPNVFLYPTDLAKAKELILTGFQEGDSFELMFDANDPREQVIAQLFQANLREIGFDLELIAVDYATLETVVFGDAPAEERPHIFGGWGWWPDYNDPWNQLAPNFLEASSPDGGNGGYYVNARFEEIMAEAETYSDEARLAELMAEAQNILTEQDPPAIYYGQVVRYTVLGSDIEGFGPNPLYLDAFNFYGMSRAAS